jgi:hypothetical protein
MSGSWRRQHQSDLFIEDGARLLAGDAAKAFEDMTIERDLAEARSMS